MLIEFSVGNYRSFKERVTLSMEAADIASQPPSLDVQNVFTASPDLHLLTSAAIYGANASGKSNLIQALRFMRDFVIGSSRQTQIGESIGVEPFRLSTEVEGLPSEFEVVFLIDGVQYRYGFAATTAQVVNEWLYRLGSARETALFVRDHQQIKINPRAFREGRDLEERTRPNALFLSVVAQFNGAIAGSLLGWFGRLSINLGINDQGDMLRAFHRFEHSPYRSAIEALIRRLDVDIHGVAFERGPAAPPPGTPRELADAKNGHGPEHISIKTYHQCYDAQGQPAGQAIFDLESQESAGTRHLFALAYPLIRALLEGLVLVVDEIDARIHPNLVVALISLFNNPEANPHRAQLICTTHNTNLLSAKLFRRDQIWFVEKSRQSASDIYSLVEYRLDGKIVRNDASFEKDYVAGRYGAIPFIGNLSALLEAEHGQEVRS